LGPCGRFWDIKYLQFRKFNRIVSTAKAIADSGPKVLSTFPELGGARRLSWSISGGNLANVVTNASQGHLGGMCIKKARIGNGPRLFALIAFG
jgi:hypothetical protein